MTDERDVTCRALIATLEQYVRAVQGKVERHKSDLGNIEEILREVKLLIDGLGDELGSKNKNPNKKEV